MIKNQFGLIHKKVKEQVKIVFGRDRRKNKPYRDYLEHLFSVQTFTEDREIFMMTVTLSHRALCERLRDGGHQAVFDIISDGKPYDKPND